MRGPIGASTPILIIDLTPPSGEKAQKEREVQKTLFTLVVTEEDMIYCFRCRNKQWWKLLSIDLTFY